MLKTLRCVVCFTAMDFYLNIFTEVALVKIMYITDRAINILHFYMAPKQMVSCSHQEAGGP